MVGERKLNGRAAVSFLRDGIILGSASFTACSLLNSKVAKAIEAPIFLRHRAFVSTGQGNIQGNTGLNKLTNLQ